MDYKIVQLQFIINSNYSTEPLFKVINSQEEDVFYGVTLEECEQFIMGNYS
jgi:hypothetical protein